MDIVKITVICDGKASDKLFLEFSGKSGCWPYTDKATAKMDVAQGSGLSYAKANFPGVPVEVMNLEIVEVLGPQSSCTLGIAE